MTEQQKSLLLLGLDNFTFPDLRTMEDLGNFVENITNICKVLKKKKRRDALKRKVVPRSVYVVTHVTENSFTITFCGLAKKPI